MKQRKRKRIRIAGVIQRKDTGRPEYVLTSYGRRVRDDELEHEILITEFTLLFRDWTFDRWVKVENAEPDLVMTKDGVRCYVEVERSSKSAKQLKAKFEKYQGVDGFILIVCMTERRMERMRTKCGELVKDTALYTTFARLRETAEPWIDWYGNTTRI